MNEYQNYKGGTGRGNGKAGGRQRPSSAVNANSRLTKGTYASRGKKVGAGEFPYDEANQDDFEGEEEYEGANDPAEAIKYEIEAIEDKIQKHGGTQSCGWDASDHKDFLRVRTKHKDRVKTVAFQTEMRRAVPTADEEEIKAHIETFQKVQELLEKKKELMKKYKEAKKQSDVQGRTDHQNERYSKLNDDLNLDGPDPINPGGKRTVRQMSAAARQGVKEQLDKWKKDKEEAKLVDLEDSAKQELRIQQQVRRKKESQRADTKEHIEEYRFRKEMDK